MVFRREFRLVSFFFLNNKWMVIFDNIGSILVSSPPCNLFARKDDDKTRASEIKIFDSAETGSDQEKQGNTCKRSRNTGPCLRIFPRGWWRNIYCWNGGGGKGKSLGPWETRFLSKARFQDRAWDTPTSLSGTRRFKIFYASPPPRFLTFVPLTN